MLTIIAFPTFEADAGKLLTEAELRDIETLLASNPDVGDAIPGAGGIRKVRVGLERKGKGKRGGGRIIYYFHSDAIPLALLAIYAKGEKIDLTAAEKRELRTLVAEYVAAFVNRQGAQAGGGG